MRRPSQFPPRCCRPPNPQDCLMKMATQTGRLHSILWHLKQPSSRRRLSRGAPLRPTFGSFDVSRKSQKSTNEKRAVRRAASWGTVPVATRSAPRQNCRFWRDRSDTMPRHLGHNPSSRKDLGGIDSVAENRDAPKRPRATEWNTRPGRRKRRRGRGRPGSRDSIEHQATSIKHPTTTPPLTARPHLR